MATPLVLWSWAGLSNRLKVWTSGQVIGEATGREVTLWWPLVPECNCPFERLFEPDARVRDVAASAVEGLPAWRGWGVRPPDLLNDAAAAHPVVGYMDWLVRPADFAGHDAWWPRVRERFAELRPAAPIRARVEAIAGDFRARMIGVHLRRGDFILARPDVVSNADAALAKVDAHLDAMPDAGIFLATDDGAVTGVSGDPTEGVRERLRRRYGARLVTTTPRSLDRGVPEAIEDALVDLWLLRKSDAIVGTYGSSFSELAAFGRDVPYDVARGVHPILSRLEAFARRTRTHALIFAAARRRLGREPTSFHEAWHTVRATRLAGLIVRAIRLVRPGWRP